MSYAIYKTEAIVLRSIPDREANADVVFLTRDLGKITVRAQAARKLESKHRMQLGRYNHVIIDVVRGAHIWRLTGIHQVAQHQIFKNNVILHAFHRAAILAEHLIRGEDAHPELFDFFVSLLNYADEAKEVGAGLELFAVIHVLDMLGYWPGEKLPLEPSIEVLQVCLDKKTELVAQINEGIRATQIT